MNPNDNEELVKVAVGELVEIEMYQRALKEAGIRSHVVGQNLDASFGTALINSMELWVKESDAETAAAAIRALEERKGQPEPPPPPPTFDPPTSEPRPGHDASRGRHGGPHHREP